MSTSSPRLVRNAVIVSLLLATSAPAFAQNARERAAERRERKAEGGEQTSKAVTQAPVYPEATRQAPPQTASAKVQPRLQALFEAYEANDVAAVQPIADEIIANPAANAYEKAISARVLGAMLISTDEAGALRYLQQAIDLNGLGNNEHFESMLLVSQLLLQRERYAESLSTVDRFLAESKSQKPEHLVVRGNALFRLQRYAGAIAVLRPVVEAAAPPRADWTQLLMAAYAESDQPGEAAKLAEQVAASTPADKKAQINLAATYLQGEQYDKAAAVYETLRRSGQLTEDRDYRNLFSLYLNSDGKEAKAIEVIKEGIAKGVLKADHQTYVALAQAYFFTDQTEDSIAAYRQAAPLAPDGETYLNLSKVLANTGRDAESKAAAQQAIDKGVKNPDEARRLLAR